MYYKGLENQMSVYSERNYFLFLPLDIPFEYFRRILCNRFDQAFRRIFGPRIQRAVPDHFSVSNVGV